MTTVIVAFVYMRYSTRGRIMQIRIMDFFLFDSYQTAIIAKALGTAGNTRAINPLVSLLKGRSYVVAAAAEALGNIGDRRAARPLIEVLQARVDPFVCGRAAEALGNLGDPEAIEPLAAALQRRYLDTRSTQCIHCNGAGRFLSETYDNCNGGTELWTACSECGGEGHQDWVTDESVYVHGKIRESLSRLETGP